MAQQKRGANPLVFAIRASRDRRAEFGHVLPHRLRTLNALENLDAIGLQPLPMGSRLHSKQVRLAQRLDSPLSLGVLQEGIVVGVHDDEGAL
eukprot:CAMPEP_0115322636 /NCGR_PEP_ID=MMETSP0270-20121206/81508_1 /TAXON_ID=71861 /ORGANISM="Scrippsiella trochoidea, Strain CCMP3099" /LENGTH=91 /DNA_ID=CAMNT_0002742615 /DNA_START=79 /DNA_END=354 /DNA_ORIENTATION=+